MVEHSKYHFSKYFIRCIFYIIISILGFRRFQNILKCYGRLYKVIKGSMNDLERSRKI